MQVVRLQEPKGYCLESRIVEEPGSIHGGDHQSKYGSLKIVSNEEFLSAVESGPGYGKRGERDVMALRTK
jgi:hypothetical protein